MLARFELFNDQSFDHCIYKVGNPLVEFSGVYIEVID
jgi:hypothetical protein